LQGKNLHNCPRNSCYNHFISRQSTLAVRPLKDCGISVRNQYNRPVMGQIKVLDRNMVNMIAAGEVIERPAGVVKELMENSIDAGATKITVSIEDGGRKLISVTDNGCGMDAEDLAAAFEPHCTSKIQNTEDLQHISTLGFRGEALASIGSVAQIKAVSRPKGSTGGNCIEIDCGRKRAVCPCSADYGTTIQVRDIFYKLPARRKFLKTANTEAGYIIEAFKRIALVNSELDMKLTSNGRVVYELFAGDGLRRRIAEMFSSEIAENLIETQSSEKRLEIFALLGKPSISKTNNKFQHIFLNGRFIRDKFISHAIKEAYRGLIEPGRFAMVFLYIKMPCEDFDVNVHPTKVEVRFYNSNLVHSQVLGCIREKLLGLDLAVDARIGYDTGRKAEINEALKDFFKKHRAGQSQHQFGFRGKTAAVAQHKTDIPKTVYTGVPVSIEGKISAIQIHNSYIVSQTDEGFVIIDQHALHERIIYEQLRSRLAGEKLQAQKLLLPESFEVNRQQKQAIKDNLQLLERLGIELIDFGPDVMAIQGFPSLLSRTSAVEFVGDLLDLLMDKESAGNTERLFDDILNMTACKAAIKAGQKLTAQEIEQLLSDKSVIDYASRCPHGRPTTIRFSLAELEKQFKRT